MIAVRTFQIAGKCHNYDMEQCQDQVKIISDAERTTIVLCDGAGSSPFGKEAANETAEIIGNDIHDHFERYLYGIVSDTKRRLAQIVDNGLNKKANILSIDSRLLATTIMAVSMDKEGRFIGVHLGDGNILWNVKEEIGLKTISSPQRGYHRNSTFLTMNCPLFYYMRFYRWEKPEAERIILLSDGMDCLCSDLEKDTFIQGNQKSLRQRMIESNSYDDMSYVLCELLE